MTTANDNVIRPYRGRQLDESRPVFLYRNLTRRGKVYSLRQGGVVVAHAERVCLKDCTLHVSEKGRERVLRTGKKCVHAGIRGTVVGSGMGTTAKDASKLVPITYDPQKAPHFMRGNSAVFGAWFVACNERGVSGAYTH